MPRSAKVLVFQDKPAFSDLALPQTCAVGGRVREASSRQGLRDVTVRLWQDDWTLVGAVQTDDRGGYRFEGVRAGAYFASVDVPPAYLFESSETALQLVAGGLARVDFVLRASGRVMGRVVDEALGTPLAGVAVAAFNAKGQLLAESKTSSSGDYAFEGLVAGSLRLQVLD